MNRLRNLQSLLTRDTVSFQNKEAKMKMKNLGGGIANVEISITVSTALKLLIDAIRYGKVVIRL